MFRSIRVKKKFLVIGVLGLVFSLAMPLLYLLDDPMPPRAEVVMTAFVMSISGAFAALASYLLLVYFRSRLEISESQIVRRGVFLTRSIDLAEVNEVRWIAFRLGAIILRGPGERLKIDFEDFRSDDVLWLIRHFRRVLPTTIEQEDWNLFSHKVAVPLRDEPRRTTPRPDEVLHQRKHVDRLMMSMTILVIAGGGFAWWIGNARALMTLPVAIGLWLLARFSIPKQGTLTKKVTSRSQHPLLFLAIMIPAVPVVLMLAVLIEWMFGVRREFVMIPFVIAMFPAMLFLVSRFERQTKKRDEAEAPRSAEVWERGEAECR